MIAIDVYGPTSLWGSSVEALTGWEHKNTIGKNLTDAFVIINEQMQERPGIPVMVALREVFSVDLVN